jgi:hypothetical protein
MCVCVFVFVCFYVKYFNDNGNNFYDVDLNNWFNEYMSADEKTSDEMIIDEITLDEMTSDKMTSDEMTLDEMIIDEITLDEMT